MKKLSNTEDESKKSSSYEKSVYFTYNGEYFLMNKTL